MRQILLTMPQLLALATASLAPSRTPYALVPLTSLARSKWTADERWNQLTADHVHAERVTLSGVRRVNAFEAATISRLDWHGARRTGRLAQADFVRSVGSDPDRFFVPWAKWETEIADDDTLAAAWGPALSGLDADLDLPAWANVATPGWRSSPLGADCKQCGAAYSLVDWWHPAATRHKNRCLVVCPEHGRMTAPMKSPYAALVRARRQFDTALALQPAEGTDHHVYVLEVLDLGEPWVYVGESAKDPGERLRDHLRPGPKQAKVFGKLGGRPGELVAEDTAGLPPLLTRTSSRAAGAWVAEVIRVRGGRRVSGGH